MPFSACNSINQERTACVLGNRIYNEATKRKAIRKFLFPRRFWREGKFSLRHTNFPILFPFFRISGKAFFPFFIITCVGEVFDQYSHNTALLASCCSSLEKTFFLSSFLNYQYIACGVWLIFAITSPLRLGKKVLEIFDWLTPFFLSRYAIAFSLAAFLDQSFNVRFLPIPIAQQQ